MGVNKILLAYFACLYFSGVTDANKTSLFHAVKNDDAESIRQEVKRDPSIINTKGVGGQTPLMYAVLSGKLSAVKTLLQLGADTSMGEEDGYTPLHGAGFQGRAEIAKLLLEEGGLDPFERHEDGFIPLHRACWGQEQRHTDTVQVFVEQGGVSHRYKASNGKTCKSMTKNRATLALLDQYDSIEL